MAKCMTLITTNEVLLHGKMYELKNTNNGTFHGKIDNIKKYKQTFFFMTKLMASINLNKLSYSWLNG